MISAELARSRVSTHRARRRRAALPRVENRRSPPPPALAGHGQLLLSSCYMNDEQPEVAKCLWPQAAHIDTPPYDTRQSCHTHKTQTKPRQRGGSARRIRGDRAVRRRLRRSIGESGGGGWGAAEGRGRGRRQVGPWWGSSAATAGAGGVGIGIGGRRRRRRQGWVAASSLPSPPSLPSTLPSSTPLASASGARRRLETGPAPTNEQAEHNVRW